MTACIVVVFRQHFGKPLANNSLNNSLASQTIYNRATVDTLLTKPALNQKPLTIAYDLSFKKLTENFQKQNLKHLICFPMGYVQDRIELDNFVENIKNILVTEANIRIVVYNKNPKS